MEGRIFISYATPDFTSAERVRKDLEADGLACWMATRDVRAGADYASAITDAIAAAPLVIVLFSGAAAASEHVERELHLAVSRKIKIVPLRLEPIEPQGAFAYLLANTQRIDVFPRLEPQLGHVRAEIRNVLLAQGTVLPPPRRSPFWQILGTAAAWAVVFLFEGLLLWWMQRTWFNLVSYPGVPLAAIGSPVPALILLAPVIAALACQFWAHRDPGRVLTLDALFSTRGWGPRLRLAGAAVLCTVAAAGSLLAPATVRVRLVNGRLDGDDAHLKARGCLSSPSYVTQTETHYAVEVRVGAKNPPGAYRVRTELAPYATDTGVEFCDIWLDRNFGVASVALRSNDERASGYVDVEAPIDRLAGSRSILFNVRYYRDGSPTANTRVRASIVHGSVQVLDEEPISLPIH